MTYHAKNFTKGNRANKIKIILVDDSKVVLSVFERVLSSSGFIEIVGMANSASEALSLMNEVSADIILLDIEMPNRSGLDALPDIIAKAGDGKVIIVSAFVDSSGPSAIKALSLGACDTLAKPGKGGANSGFSRQLLDKIIRLTSHNQTIAYPNNSVDDNILALEEPAAICLGASTGGIPAIQEFLTNLSPNVTAPIFIAQHLPEAFISYFARQLRLGSREVVAVDDRNMIENGKIYLASGNGHLMIKRSLKDNYATRVDSYKHSNYTPSVDALFHSAADIYDSQALAIVFSGMGHDGAAGAASLHAKNSKIWVQDQVSSVVWGMPGSVVSKGVSSAQLNPKNMADAVNRIFTP